MDAIWKSRKQSRSILARFLRMKIFKVKMSKPFAATIVLFLAFILSAQCGMKIKRSKLGCAKCGRKTQKFRAFTPVQSLNLSEGESAFGKLDSGEICHLCLH